jgi:NRPS condensation-like uncharacterized protein
MNKSRSYEERDYDASVTALAKPEPSRTKESVGEQRLPASPLASVPGSFNKRSRHMLLPERTMYRDGKTPFTSVFTIRLHGELLEARVKQALSNVQNKHPMLRCIVEDSDNGPRFVLQEQFAPISLRMVPRKGDSDWQNEVYREWGAPFDAGREPLLRMVWLHAEDIHELILAGHHCICDGHSGVNILREFLYAYDRPSQQLGAYDELVAIEDLMPADQLRDRRFRRRVRLKTNLLKLALLMKRRRGRRLDKPRVSLEQMYFHRWCIDKTATSALTDRCRLEGVTVLSAVSVAFIQAFRIVCGTAALRKAYTMVNARRFLPQLRADAMFGLVSGVPLLLKGAPSPAKMSVEAFWTYARAIKADMTRRVDRLGKGLYEYMAALEGLHEKYSTLVADTESAFPIRHVTLSNMGRIDLPQQCGGLQVEAVFSPLVMVSPSPANTVVISSFAGQMEFAIVSDEDSLPRKQMLEIAQKAMEILNVCMVAPAERSAELVYTQSTPLTEAI